MLKPAAAGRGCYAAAFLDVVVVVMRAPTEPFPRLCTVPLLVRLVVAAEYRVGGVTLLLAVCRMCDSWLLIIVLCCSLGN